MKYFKNTELAKLYNVSEKSVRNWIEATKQGRLGLQLYEENDHTFIANTSSNSLLIEQLVVKGRKYKNSRGYKVVSPASTFYELFGSKEIFNIASSLDIYHELPLQYSYFDGGAAIWDAYIQKLSQEDTPNALTNTVELLDINLRYIDEVLGGSKINIVDVGLGNCYPVRKLLEHFSETGQLNRYIGLDISRDMLKIAERNIHEWFGDKVKFEGYQRDITYERFGSILAPDFFSKEEEIRNVVLFLGSTLSNFRDPNQPLATIHESMGKNDLLVFSKQLDTTNSRRYFDFSTTGHEKIKGTPKSKFMLDLLNIDESLYDIEQFFDEKGMARKGEFCLKMALTIEFELDGKSKAIHFNKGDRILIWRHNHQNTVQAIEQFEQNNFDLLQASTSKDGEYMLTISKIKLDDN